MRVEFTESERKGSLGIFKYLADEGETADELWCEAFKELKEEFPDDRVIFLGPLNNDDVLLLEVVEA